MVTPIGRGDSMKGLGRRVEHRDWEYVGELNWIELESK